ncbi:MAG: PilZ domain-containing protein [Candidatus Omnitrophica bacterium]|nr:PilZ domain-containing protein [Candidatus Omnitrophota bacterium]MDD5355233.1 PilZ domain-containing protein [Candidatus Omnitrophota bacterium]
MPWQGVNQRIFPRANYPCVVRLREKKSAETFNTKTENIGCGGVCVMLPKNIGMFSPVEMEIDISGEGGNINCDGIIVWIVRRQEISKDKADSFDTGIEFKNLKEEHRLIIDKIVQECLKKDKS